MNEANLVDPTELPAAIPPHAPGDPNAEDMVPTSIFPALAMPPVEKPIVVPGVPPAVLPPVTPPPPRAAMRTAAPEAPAAVPGMPASLGAWLGRAVHALRGEWSRTHVATACAAIGASFIVAALIAGYHGLGADHAARPEEANVVAATIVARALLAIATMVLGWALIRMAERLAASPARRDHS
jgi:hypothetical protein